MKFSDAIFDHLLTENYTHCFFVAGGNSMHLLNSARSRFQCIPVVHEVSAGIAAEYFNRASFNSEKAFVLVTAGPGLTNIVTSIAGAYLESRNLLIIGGQVKTSDLKSEGLRQNGIQEIDGRKLVESITSKSHRLDKILSRSDLSKVLESTGKPGPIFLEIPLDVQAFDVPETWLENFIQGVHEGNPVDVGSFVDVVIKNLHSCERPVLLLGGGLSRELTWGLQSQLSALGIPVMTTWNGAELYGSDQKNYWGRPNTWGQRSANILIQQCDLLIAVGTRLGLQQTGFAWQEFCPLAKIFQVDIDIEELTKGHPQIELGIATDAFELLEMLISKLSSFNKDFNNWLTFGKKVIEGLPLSSEKNLTGMEFVDPFNFVSTLSRLMNSTDIFVPCSSGGAFTVAMQAFDSKQGQVITTNKGLASMGYGLAGAIGSALASKRRTILIEGDGGFSQNLQELGTVAQQNLNLKMFIFANQGYASIRMTQRNYFDGAYLGCDTQTGLGLPNWMLISAAYGINYTEITGEDWSEVKLKTILDSKSPEFVVIQIDPEQTYWPKINSRVIDNGQMVSNPLHQMHPPLNDDQVAAYLPFLTGSL